MASWSTTESALENVAGTESAAVGIHFVSQWTDVTDVSVHQYRVSNNSWQRVISTTS
jgi:hypothetical protein